MALATQCPHCYTTFRVANDQLKLHAGLVRCGKCQQTFNGVEHLLAPGAKPALPHTIQPAPLSSAEPVPTSTTISTPAQTAASTTTSAMFRPVQVPIPEITPEIEDEGEAKHNAEHNAEHTAENDAVFVTPFSVTENDAFQHRAETTHLDLSHIDSIRASNSNGLDFDLGDHEPAFQKPEAKTAIAPQAKRHQEDDADEPLGLLTQETLINKGDDDASALEAAEAWQEPFLKDIPDTEVSATDDITITEEEARTAELAWNAMANISTVETNTTVATDETMAEANAESEEEKPTFVLQAEKKLRRSKVVRITLIISSILLFFSVLAQSTYILRHSIAAWFPPTKPALQQACKLLQCRIEMLTQIEVISIESNELLALSADSKVFSLAIQLQNKSSTLQAWPMLELILNDAKEKPVLRRVFPPADYLSNKTDLVKGFAPNSEQPIKLYFELSGPPAAGYHLGVFYP